jgi:hypothetical protein
MANKLVDGVLVPLTQADIAQHAIDEAAFRGGPHPAAAPIAHRWQRHGTRCGT